MQLLRKTLQTNLSVIKLKVTPLDHPLKKTKWFWQHISFQNHSMENPGDIVDIRGYFRLKLNPTFECHPR